MASSTSSVQQKQIDNYMRVRKDVVRTVKGGQKVKPTQVPTVTVPATSLADLEELRKFDLDPSFGPCIDSPRMDRWERADELGLDPPLHIKDLILSHRDDPKYTQSVWQNYALLSTPET